MPASLPTPLSERPDRRCDVLIIGAGAAGMFAALAARGVLDSDGRGLPLTSGAPDVVLLNNEDRLGLKILVSGGGRCNVTNADVDERDYDSDAPHLVRRILRGFPPASIRNFFESRECPLYEEALGKLFPKSDDAHDILRILLFEIVRAEIPLLAPAEVIDLERMGSGDDGDCDGEMRAHLEGGDVFRARRIILATGGKSLPKTGSRGFGIDALRRLGHPIESPMPALTPILLDDASPIGGLAGLTVPVVLSLVKTGIPPNQLAGRKFRPIARSAGSLLVTHRGATGPAPFDVSGPCGQALARGGATLLADFWSLALPEGPWAPYRDLDKPPGAALRPEDAPRPPSREEFASQVEPILANRDRSLGQALAERLPRSLVQALLRAGDLDPGQLTKQLDGSARADRLWLALTQADLRLSGCEGFAKAEVTSGGLRLDDLRPASLESRRCPGLFCCGEVVNVTGRLGGFNFQWAWSSGFAAGRGAAKAIRAAD